MRADDYVEASRGQVDAVAARRSAGILAPHPCYSLFVNGELAGCGGVIPIWSDGSVVEGWAVLTNVGRKNPIAITRAIRDGLRLIVGTGRVRRIQCDVIADFWAGQKWAEKFGFEFESRMVKYGPQGQDFVRYAMFPKERT